MTQVHRIPQALTRITSRLIGGVSSLLTDAAPTQVYEWGEWHRPYQYLHPLASINYPMFDQVPPELFARIFEIGVETWGLEFLPPVCLVCRTWNELVESTPRLWGIISIDRRCRTKKVEIQITKAKASQLTIYARRADPASQLIILKLASLARNWLRADVATSVLRLTGWTDLRGGLEELYLVDRGGFDTADETTADDFFKPGTDTVPQGLPKLRTFVAHGLDEPWVTRFLSLSITHFELSHIYHRKQPLSTTFDYLSLIPNVVTLGLLVVLHSTPSLPPGRFLHLTKLTTLTISGVLHFADLLCRLHLPSLQTLSITQPYPGSHSSWDDSMSPLFSQWSQPDFTPANLHTLELCNCLSSSNIPYLIRWLARLPSLIRLIIRDDSLGGTEEPDSSTIETDLYKALASPQGAGEVVGGWLCPSLMQLCLETDLQVTDLIPIARARGGISTALDSVLPPNRLRQIEAVLCPSGNEREIGELMSLVDNAICVCFGCNFKLEL